MPTTSPNTILHGDALARLRELPDACIQCCVTSPPYFGLRSYLPDGHADKPVEIGLEETPDAYIQKLVEVFREVKRVLKDNGTLWLNIGDSYCGYKGDHYNENHRRGTGEYSPVPASHNRGTPHTMHGIKNKDLIGIPWMLAFALRADGWYLRMDCIWNKPNCMPESVKDRPTKSHEYLFLLSKSEKYYYDQDAIREPATEYIPHTLGRVRNVGGRIDGFTRPRGNVATPSGGRNKRSVWTIPTRSFSGARLLADYVGSDGRFYKVSEDCPIHGLQCDSYTRQMGKCDGPQGGVSSRTSDKSIYHVQEHQAVSSSTPSHANRDCVISNAHKHNHESMRESRNVGHFDNSEPQIGRDTVHTLEISSCSSDSHSQTYAQIATDHSNGNHRTDLVPETNSACMPSAGTASDILDTSMLPLWSELDGYMSESNREQDDKNVRTSVQTPYRNTGNASVNTTSFPYAHGITAKCVCQEIKLDHFAVMPEALVEPCILAGSQPGDIVLDPFSGAGTVALVAAKHGRSYLGIELNAEYIQLATTRLSKALGIWQEEVAV